MAEEFGQYNFNFIHYVIQKAEITDNTLTIERMNGYTVGRIIFEELEEGFESDDRMIDGGASGIYLYISLKNPKRPFLLNLPKWHKTHEMIWIFHHTGDIMRRLA